MKPESPLLGCFAKIEWAKAEINELARAVGRLYATPIVKNLPPRPVYAAQRPLYPGMYPTGFHKITANVNADGIEVWRYAVPEIPTALNVTVGAILHSLRTPLDQMLSAIALQNHASPRGVGFPFGRTHEEFATALDKQKKLPPDARALIAKLRPYPVGGNALLYALHALNNPDKHHPGLVPINLQTVTNFQGVMVFRGMILTFGPRTGRHFAMDMDYNFSQSDRAKQPGIKVVGEEFEIILGADLKGAPSPEVVVTKFYNQMGEKPRRFNLPFYLDKIVLPPDAPKDDMEIATAIPGTKFEAQVHPSFNIALGDVEGFEREPVVAVLHQMRQLVERILQTFECRFFPK